MTYQMLNIVVAHCVMLQVPRLVLAACCELTATCNLVATASSAAQVFAVRKLPQTYPSYLPTPTAAAAAAAVATAAAV
jgi:hypothetical protein